MLAIPLDSKNATTISKLYGKAPFFALLDTKLGHFKVVENEVVGDGPKSAPFLSKYGVTSTIFYHMGEGVYKSFEKERMSVYTVEQRPCSIDEIYVNMQNKKFQKLDSQNFSTLLDSGESNCTCGCKK
jgi:predicted Fe-Mo cluster-binding NifX family protein